MEALNYEISHFEKAVIIVCQIPENIEDIIQDRIIPEYYQEEMNKLGTDKRKREYIIARLAINKLLGKEVRILYNAVGKPLLHNHEGHISISHSRQFLAVIYHPQKPTGIDIECPSERVLKVYKRYLNETEQKYLSTDLLKLQLAWSVKEALYKMNGEEFVNFSTSMQIRDFIVSDAGEIFCEQPGTQNVYQLYYEAQPNYNLVYTIAR